MLREPHLKTLRIFIFHRRQNDKYYLFEIAKHEKTGKNVMFKRFAIESDKEPHFVVLYKKKRFNIDKKRILFYLFKS